MTTATRYFVYGLFFSCTTVLFWGMLPIALKVSNGFADPVTLTWLRFTFAGVVVFAWQWYRGVLSEFLQLTRGDWFKLALAGAFLIGNYTSFAWGLNYLNPEAAQLGMQVAPLFLALGGMLLFKERISVAQWGCFALLFSGLLIFFHPVLTNRNLDVGPMITGFSIILFSAISWSFYALAQKTLFNKLNSSNILLAIYLFAMVAMLPFTTPSQITNMNSTETWTALFCCMNTLIAYGSFAQALRYWETMQVSAIIAMTPVVAYLLTELCMVLGLWTGLVGTTAADWLSLSGMVLVVASAMLVQYFTALDKRKRSAQLNQPSCAS